MSECECADCGDANFKLIYHSKTDVEVRCSICNRLVAHATPEKGQKLVIRM